MIKTTKQICDFERRFTFESTSIDISALYPVGITNYVDYTDTLVFLNICVIRGMRKIQCDNFQCDKMNGETNSKLTTDL